MFYQFLLLVFLFPNHYCFIFVTLFPFVSPVSYPLTYKQELTETAEHCAEFLIFLFSLHLSNVYLQRQDEQKQMHTPFL